MTLDKERFGYFFRGLRKLLICWVAMYALILVWRNVFFISYVPTGIFGQFKANVPLMVWNGFRFDMMVLGYLNALPLVLIMLPWEKTVSKILRVYYVIAFTFLVAALTVDYYYYRNFNDHFNIVLFTFFDEEPWSLVETMWQEYPMFWVILGLALLLWGSWKLLGRLWIRTPGRGWPRLAALRMSWLAMPLAAALMFLGMRGSVHACPLQAGDIRVSVSHAINDCVPNPLFMLKKTIKEKYLEYSLVSVRRSLAMDGFSSLDEAIETAGWSDKDDASLPENERLERVLFSRSDSLPYARPNVVVIFSESWSQYLSELDSPGCDLLDAMRPHMQQDLLFDNIQSVRNGTIFTVETFIPASPYKQIFSTRFSNIPYRTSVASAFKKNGYFTAFLTGMERNWENSCNGLMAQGIDSVFSKKELLQKHPEYGQSLIGLYDGYMLDGLLDELEDDALGEGRPKFFLSVTTTNHPPFELDPAFVPEQLPDSIFKSRAFIVDKLSLEKYLYGAQYSNRQMGLFMDRLKASELAENTVVIITGDHNVRSILDSRGHMPLEYRHRVPLYMYLPPYIREQFPSVDTHRLGDHYDIIPTLAQLALSDTEYLSMGTSLLAPSGKDFSYNEMLTLPENTAAIHKSAAREALLKAWFQTLWSTLE